MISGAVLIAASLEGAGWAGAALTLFAYAVVANGRWRADDPRYHTANVIGAAGLLANAMLHHAWPSLLTNAIWISLAAYALSRRGFYYIDATLGGDDDI